MRAFSGKWDNNTPPRPHIPSSPHPAPPHSNPTPPHPPSST